MTPDFEALATSWDLSLRADGYAGNTLRCYRRALVHLTEYLGDVDPQDVTRDQVRAWIVATREATSSGTARSHFAGVRHFFRWAKVEEEITTDPTEGIKTPAANQVTTELLTPDSIKKMLDSCAGSGFVARRDRAILLLFADGGLRLAELAGLQVDAVDLQQRIVFVEGKGSNRSGPRRRAVPVGVKAAQALDRYLRERRKHPQAHLAGLWLGDRNRGVVSWHGIQAIVKRRAALVGVQVHPHQFRHTWADAFRAAGGSEGDLMVLGGWKSRVMLDRYGRAGAERRAHEAYARLSLGDRL